MGPERKFALCQERPRQEEHCSRLGRWLGEPYVTDCESACEEQLALKWALP